MEWALLMIEKRVTPLLSPPKDAHIALEN